MYYTPRLGGDMKSWKEYYVDQLSHLNTTDFHLIMLLVSNQGLQALVQAKLSSGHVAETITANPNSSAIEILQKLEPWLETAVGDKL